MFADLYITCESKRQCRKVVGIVGRAANKIERERHMLMHQAHRESIIKPPLPSVEIKVYTKSQHDFETARTFLESAFEDYRRKNGFKVTLKIKHAPRESGLPKGKGEESDAD